jgi:hypothetical protein
MIPIRGSCQICECGVAPGGGSISEGRGSERRIVTKVAKLTDLLSARLFGAPPRNNTLKIDQSSQRAHSPVILRRAVCLAVLPFMPAPMRRSAAAHPSRAQPGSRRSDAGNPQQRAQSRHAKVPASAARFADRRMACRVSCVDDKRLLIGTTAQSCVA